MIEASKALASRSRSYLRALRRLVCSDNKETRGEDYIFPFSLSAQNNQERRLKPCVTYKTKTDSLFISSPSSFLLIFYKNWSFLSPPLTAHAHKPFDDVWNLSCWNWLCSLHFGLARQRWQSGMSLFRGWGGCCAVVVTEFGGVALRRPTSWKGKLKSI